MAEISIKTDQNGQLGMAVSNDISGNAAVVLGLIELAKHAWLKQLEAAERRVQPATHIPVNLS